jgi:hypothetical protein
VHQVLGRRRVADERDHVVAALVEPLDDGPPDEAGPTGHHDAHQLGSGSDGQAPMST